MSSSSVFGAVFAALAVTFLPVAAYAEPQGNAGLTVGMAGRSYRHNLWDNTVFHLGMRGDVLFGQDGASDVGVGPYAELFTHAFDELQVGHGVSVALPVVDTFPLVLSAGNYVKVRDDRFGAEVGVAGALFFGTRGYNFSANYAIAAGLLVQGRVGLMDSRETSIIVGLHLDAAMLGAPLVFLIDAIRGGSREVDPVP